MHGLRNADFELVVHVASVVDILVHNIILPTRHLLMINLSKRRNIILILHISGHRTCNYRLYQECLSHTVFMMCIHARRVQSVHFSAGNRASSTVTQLRCQMAHCWYRTRGTNTLARRQDSVTSIHSTFTLDTFTTFSHTNSRSVEPLRISVFCVRNKGRNKGRVKCFL